MRLSAWGETHVGDRSSNADAKVIDEENGFFMVADGMGQDQRGATPAALAVDILKRAIGERPSRAGQRSLGFDPARQAADRLAKAFTEASQIIFDKIEADVTARGFSSTATALQFVGYNAVIVHAGDSRAYLSREGGIHQLTEDHTMVKALLQAGVLTKEDAASYPYAAVLARSLGKSPAVQSDTIVVDASPGDCFILCTDGLSDHIPPVEVDRIVNANEPRQAAQRLMAMARERRVKDDATVIVVRVEGARTTTGQIAVPAQDKADFLRRVFLFKDLNFQESMRILAVVREQRCRDGEVIIREGEQGDAFYVLAEGRAAVTQSGIPVATIAAGGHFGELGLLGPGIRSATVTAVGNVMLYVVNKPDFYDLVAKDQTLGIKLLWGFLQNLGERVKTLTTHVTGRGR